jgi:hypothetical protein
MGNGGTSKGSRTTLPRWQQWENVGELGHPATRCASQCFAQQKRQTASIRPNDSVRSEFEHGHRASGNRDRSWGGDGKKSEGMEDWADVRGGWLPTVADVSRVCCAKSDCDDGGGADLAGDGRRRVWWESVTEREAVTEMGGVVEGESNGTQSAETMGRGR